jgi:formylmethanofuran dehydrogenase subunit A
MPGQQQHFKTTSASASFEFLESDGDRVKNGLTSYLIPGGGDLWRLIQNASCEVDRLPDFTLEMVDILTDYLATECRTILPRAVGINPRGTCTPVITLTWHEAAVLRAKLKKNAAPSMSELLYNYCGAGAGGTDWAQFLSRQSTYFTSNDQRIVIVGSGPTVLFDDTIFSSAQGQ